MIKLWLDIRYPLILSIYLFPFYMRKIFRVIHNFPLLKLIIYETYYLYRVIAINNNTNIYTKFGIFTIGVIYFFAIWLSRNSWTYLLIIIYNKQKIKNTKYLFYIFILHLMWTICLWDITLFNYIKIFNDRQARIQGDIFGVQSLHLTLLKTWTFNYSWHTRKSFRKIRQYSG